MLDKNTLGLHKGVELFQRAVRSTSVLGESMQADRQAHIGTTPCHTEAVLVPRSLRGDRFRLFMDQCVRPSHGLHALLPDREESLVEAGVLLSECLRARTVSLHNGLNQGAMLILLKQHELPERLGAGLRHRSRESRCMGADELISDLPLKNRALSQFKHKLVKT